MNKRILVAYATKSGTTLQVARTIVETLRTSASVECLRADHISDISRYDAVIIGSGVRAGKWLKEAHSFVERFQGALQERPVAYFTVCITMADDTPENRDAVIQYMQPERELVEPVSMGLFAGKLDPALLTWSERLLIKFYQVPEGDFRDWDSIAAWTKHIQPMLLGETAVAS